jgi:hypothetical protein
MAPRSISKTAPISMMSSQSPSPEKRKGNDMSKIQYSATFKYAAGDFTITH